MLREKGRRGVGKQEYEYKNGIEMLLWDGYD